MRISDWSSDVCSSDLIDARFRIQLLILHEHKIPDFNESVAIFIGGARGASWNMRAMIIEDFRTGATWTRISHRPEIIRRSDADDSFAGQARNFTPKLESLFIVVVHGDGQTIGGDAPFLRSDEHTYELTSLMRISYADI